MNAKELKLELSKQGYATKVMWHMDDVSTTLAYMNDMHDTNHRLSAMECSDIMDEIISSDQVYEFISELIHEAITKRFE
jgi:hypothetical protein